ncbi:MAG: IS21 family transposase, partial [Geminicoccaceae bacterium]
TLDAHKPANHKAMEGYTPERVAAELAAIGPAAARFYQRIRADADHPLQAVRQGRGLLRLAALHGATRLEATCQAALVHRRNRSVRLRLRR